MTKLTEAQLAKYCSYIARSAAGWAGDLIDNPGAETRAVDAKFTSRFTDDIRLRLDFIDALASHKED